jgi:NAD(P)-dependent dehydrogenase (short-subunit alcohol dehydrogenase family)
MFELRDRVAIVTGAAGNLGSAVARAFLDADVRLVLVDRRKDRLPEMFPDLVDSPDHYLAMGVDLTDTEAVQEMVEESLRRMGRIDILVNAVGGYSGGTPAHETTLETWDYMMDLNARTALIASRAVIPAMLAQGAGKIVNVGSRAGLSGSAKAAAYSAAKSAAIRLTESLSADLKKSGINVNCVVPGTIDTPENREDMPKADFSRWVAPEAVADVIVFLVSDAARAVHGAVVSAYGLS